MESCSRDPTSENTEITSCSLDSTALFIPTAVRLVNNLLFQLVFQRLAFYGQAVSQGVPLKAKICLHSGRSICAQSLILVAMNTAPRLTSMEYQQRGPVTKIAVLPRDVFMALL